MGRGWSRQARGACRTRVILKTIGNPYGRACQVDRRKFPEVVAVPVETKPTSGWARVNASAKDCGRVTSWPSNEVFGRATCVSFSRGRVHWAEQRSRHPDKHHGHELTVERRRAYRPSVKVIAPILAELMAPLAVDFYDQHGAIID